ncbi:MAG: prepilin-type N-terminal cleavage/methylation domain-containing protein [Gammaproteobacteria bacterium]|nr:prepilin-type N-terminal cleavage/methylation domain-containing protein [Gammaproteobacteria bacterium]
MILHRQSGFTLIELMVTLAILFILLLVALPSFNSSMATSELRSARESVFSAFRYAKTTSRTTGLSVILSTDASTNIISFSLPNGNNILPDNTKMNAISLPEKISITGSNNTYSFKPNGIINDQSSITITSDRIPNLSQSIQIVDALGHLTSN